MKRANTGPKNRLKAEPSDNCGQSGVTLPPAKRIRLLVAEDHPVVRKGIIAFLSKHPGVEVLGEAKDGQEALNKAKELTPDVILMDIDMPRVNGLAVTELLRKDLPQVKVLILSGQPSTRYVLRIVQSGARGYIAKEASAEELFKAVQTVADGGTCFGPEVAKFALDQIVRQSGDGAGAAQLTDREREILVLIAEGLYNKEVGARLNISTRTVETHRERIMRKLGVHSTAGLTKYAVANGLITLPTG
jgi:two-component system nitrate/nitrite response regulator NarL